MLLPQQSSQGSVAENCSCSCDSKRVGQRETEASLSVAQDHPAEVWERDAPKMQLLLSHNPKGATKPRIPSNRSSKFVGQEAEHLPEYAWARRLLKISAGAGGYHRLLLTLITPNASHWSQLKLQEVYGQHT